MIELGYHPSSSPDDFKPGYRYVSFPSNSLPPHSLPNPLPRPSNNHHPFSFPPLHPHPSPYTLSTKINNNFPTKLTIPHSIYISGDTLLIPELSSIPQRYPHIDLLLIHLGGTTIPHPSMPLLMVTMDAEMGVQLVQLVRPELTIPIHYE